LTHPDYKLDFLEAGPFQRGATVPIKFIITRSDNAAVDAPTSAQVVVRRVVAHTSSRLHPFVLDVVPTALTADVDPAPPALSQVAAALWAVGPPGDYVAIATVAMPDGQVVSGRLPVSVE
jgi:hypothetical protein